MKRGYRDRVSGTAAGGPKKGLDPVAAYLRFRLSRIIGDGAGQITQKEAARRLEMPVSGLNQFIHGVTKSVRPKKLHAFARLLKIRGNPDRAAECLVRDAGEWYGSLVEGSLPILSEPAVQEAISLVAQAERVSPKVIEGLLSRFGNSAFLGRDRAYWVRTLSEEVRFDAAAEHELASGEK